MSEPLELSFCADLTAPLERVKAVDSNDNGLELIFDVVPYVVVKPTAQLVTGESSQIAASIHEKLCVGNIVVLVKFRKKRMSESYRCGRSKFRMKQFVCL